MIKVLKDFVLLIFFVIYSNHAGGSFGYNQAFNDAATSSGFLITVNYSSTTTNIDNIIATKSSSSNVIKGSLLN